MNIRSVFSNFLINNFYFYPHYTLCIINWSIFPSIQSSFDDLLKSITSIQTDTWNSELHGEFLSELLGTFHTLLHTDVLDWDKRTHIQGSHSWMLTYQKVGYTLWKFNVDALFTPLVELQGLNCMALHLYLSESILDTLNIFLFYISKYK